MSDSDMDIDDDEVQVQVKHTSARESELLGRPIEASDSQNDLKKHSAEQSKIMKGTSVSFEKSTLKISGNIGKKLEDEKGTILSRFPAPGITAAQSFPSGNEPEQKRAALVCKFFVKGWCNKGNFCKFVHVNEISNHTSPQQVASNMAGSSGIQSVEERRILDGKEGVRALNGVTSLHTRGDISLVNPPSVQRVFPFNNEMRFMPSQQNMGRESLQNCGADVTGNRSLFNNNSNSFALRSSFVQENRSLITSYRKTDMESSGPAWTVPSFSSVPMNQYASTLRNIENRNNMYGSGSLPTLQGTSVSSVKDAEEGNTTSYEKKVSSNDWEPSEPFKASFTIPPYILPSSDALYDPFIENPEDRSLNAPSSSKGKHARKNTRQQKDGDSASDPQARDCNNDDKNSSCSQNQYQEPVARKNLVAHGVVEGVATSVVDQNDATTPSKEISSSAAVENRVVLKRSKPAGHESWHRSDGSSHQKMLKSDEIDGEVRSSDAGTKVTRQFRTAVVETIKEMLKPLWREGRLTKDVHNMIVKRSAEKIVSTAVQFHQVPTETESVEQYLSMSAPKIVKLVEGYVEKYGKPS
ncbi:hypothetical protein EUTSA_v10016429mg [Eutrema salsugineum]|uniref:C3H1-type domain-containing protein n=1 Tax=Eutrema salsugineum TaxID=72664 RepID=V4NYI5_EUTSA|nr:protein FRIGIDA-ESSENTIAL 1 [Eutrema salsugineum]ESQ51986.1 hypothetical protein EUTSA_v10016429mg [Eutrema salsugineum]